MISNQFPSLIYGIVAGQTVPVGSLTLDAGGRLILTPSSGGYSPDAGFNPSIVRTANFSTVSSDINEVDTTSGALTATLPGSASVGDRIQFNDAVGNWATNNLTIARNGLKINGGTTNYTASVSGNKLTATYISVAYGWSIK